MATKQAAILIYDGFTALDAIGPYEVLSRVPGWSVTFVSEQAGAKHTDVGAALVADRRLDEVAAPELVLVAGGPGQEQAMRREPILDWLRAVDRRSELTTSVCTGSLVLAAAGLLDGRRATCHWLALERLREFGVEPVSERVVSDGKYVTAAGVSAGIDMALGLAGALAGEQVGQAIQLGIEYDPQPPWDAGSPNTAPAQTVQFLREASRHLSATDTTSAAN